MVTSKTTGTPSNNITSNPKTISLVASRPHSREVLVQGVRIKVRMFRQNNRKHQTKGRRIHDPTHLNLVVGRGRTQDQLHPITVPVIIVLGERRERGLVVTHRQETNKQKHLKILARNFIQVPPLFRISNRKQRNLKPRKERSPKTQGDPRQALLLHQVPLLLHQVMMFKSCLLLIERERRITL